jgi:hypothetical protein
MNRQREFKSFVIRHRGLARLVVVILPLVLAACTNGGGSGPGY